jgi:hypothetical protein
MAMAGADTGLGGSSLVTRIRRQRTKRRSNAWAVAYSRAVPKDHPGRCACTLRRAAPRGPAEPERRPSWDNASIMPRFAAGSAEAPIRADPSRSPVVPAAMMPAPAPSPGSVPAPRMPAPGTDERHGAAPSRRPTPLSGRTAAPPFGSVPIGTAAAISLCRVRRDCRENASGQATDHELPHADLRIRRRRCAPFCLHGPDGLALTLTGQAASSIMERPSAHRGPVLLIKPGQEQPGSTKVVP